MARPRKDINRELALVVKDLIEHKQESADIGLIIGVLGKNSLKWLQDLKKECSSIDEFLEIASKRSEIELISAAFKNAMGYDYVETDKEILKVPDGYNTDGSPRMREVEGNVKVKTRHARANDTLLKFILKNYLPEYFQDSQKIEINKKSIEIKEITAKEIESFAGKLLESVKEEKAGA